MSIFDEIRERDIRGRRKDDIISVTIRLHGVYIEAPMQMEEFIELIERAERLQRLRDERRRRERREAEEARQAKREEEEARRARQPYTSTFNFSGSQGYQGFWTAADGGNIFNEFFGPNIPRPGQEYHFNIPRPDAPKVNLPPRERLKEIADCVGVEIEDRKLLRRAQRAAHPDTGGSHELFIEVEKLAKYLKL